MYKAVWGIHEICIENEALTVRFARTPDEEKEAQRLRFDVFTTEIGAHLPNDCEQIDSDEFDPYCFHLIAIDKKTNSVVGTYRILTPENAKLVGRYYSEAEFDLSDLYDKKHALVEFGRSCTHPNYRTGSVIMNMWAALTRFVFANGYLYTFGCASVSLKNNAQDVVAALDFIEAENTGFANMELRPIHQYPYPIDRSQAGGTIPPLIKAYIRIGARVAGEPAWDPIFDVLDFPILFDVKQINPRYLERFSKTLNIESISTPI